MAMCHLCPELCGSTSYQTDNSRSGVGTMSQIPQLDKSFLYELENLETCELDRKTEITMMS